MMRIFQLCLVMSFISIFTMITFMDNAPADARETGLARLLHSFKKERGKVCMDGHFHYGSSKDQDSQRLALRAAKRAWRSFTVFEYGTVWGSFRHAAQKGKKCSKSSDGKWGCDVSARPCRR